MCAAMARNANVGTEQHNPQSIALVDLHLAAGRRRGYAQPLKEIAMRWRESFEDRPAAPAPRTDQMEMQVRAGVDDLRYNRGDDGHVVLSRFRQKVASLRKRRDSEASRSDANGKSIADR
jgi:hypothetical protein